MLNVPVVEDLAAEPRRVLHDAAATATSTITTRDEYFSDANDMVFLGSLRFLPTDDVTFDLSGTWSRSHTNGQGGQCIVVREDGPVAPLFPQLFPACRATTLFSVVVGGRRSLRHRDRRGVGSAELRHRRRRGVRRPRDQGARIVEPADDPTALRRGRHDRVRRLSLDRRPTAPRRRARRGAAGVRRAADQRRRARREDRVRGRPVRAVGGRRRTIARPTSVPR